MRLPRLRLTAAVLAVCVSALTLGVASPAEAHKHPTPVQLVSPAVVRIMTYGKVSISLIEHNSLGATGNDISLVQRSYQPMLATGSGFVVNPSGTIVTSPTVTGVDLQRAAIFAVNKIFNERYGDGAPMPADPYTKATPSGNTADVVGQRLQRCYQGNTTDESGGCVIFTQAVVTVQPFVSDQKQFGDLPAQILYPTGGTKSNVAVLKVGASSMPSVVLGSSNSDVAAVSTLGFTSTPAGEKSLKSIQGHFLKKGATTLKVDEYLPSIKRGLTEGLAGGPVVSEKGQVVGLLTLSGQNVTLIGPDEVADALAAVSVTSERGPTDLVYENALHNYNNELYTAAVPNLAQVLKLYPGHALATEKLAVANQRKGTSADKGSEGATDTSGFGPSDDGSTSESTNSSNVLLWGGLAAVLVLVLLLGAVLLRSRVGKKGTPAGSDPNLAAAGHAQPEFGTPYPGTVGGPPAGWPTSAPPGWVDPRQPGVPYPYGDPAYGTAPYGAPQSGVPFQQPGVDPNEQQTVMRLSPSNPPPLPPGGGPTAAGDGPVPAGGGAIEGAPTGVMARQDDIAPNCDHCGQRLQPGQQFCGYCGNRVH